VSYNKDEDEEASCWQRN